MSDSPVPETQDEAVTAADVSRWSEAGADEGHFGGLRLYSVAELAKLRRPDYLIPGILPDRGLSILYGAPGSGKSFLALDWALTIAYGGTWAGREVRQQTVVYVAAEGAYGYPPRNHAWHLANRGGEEGEPSIRFLDKPIYLAVEPQATAPEPAGKIGPDLRDLSDILKTEGLRPSLVIFDTLSRCLAGEDENSTKVLSAVVRNVENFAASSECAVLLIHHTRRRDNEIRGSGVLAGAANMMASVEQKKSSGTVQLHCRKMKDAPEFDGVEFRFASHGDSAVLTVTDTTLNNTDQDDEEEQLTPRQQLVLGALPATGATLPEWVKLVDAISGKDGRPSVGQSSVYVIVKRLRDSGLVHRLGNVFYCGSATDSHDDLSVTSDI